MYELDQPTRERLEKDIAELKRQLAEAHAVILKLSGQIEELPRSGKGQAVPFARREHVERPKKRGRKHGKGQFKNREKPNAEEIRETKKAALSGCPQCKCELEDVKEHEQYEIDIPVIKPIIPLYLMMSGTCPECGKRQSNLACGWRIGSSDWSARKSPGDGFETSVWGVVWQGERGVERHLSFEGYTRRLAAGRPTLGASSQAGL